MDIPARRLHAAALMDQLDRDNFISIETRVLLIDFTIYNANINTFCVVRFNLELLHIGGVCRTPICAPRWILPYQGDYGNTAATLDGLIVAWVSASVMVNLKEAVYARREGVRYESTAKKWVLLEWVFIGLSGRVVDEVLHTVSDDQAGGRGALRPECALLSVRGRLGNRRREQPPCVGALLTYPGVFKYLSNMPIVRRLLHALDAAFKDMTAFVIAS